MKTPRRGHRTIFHLKHLYLLQGPEAEQQSQETFEIYVKFENPLNRPLTNMIWYIDSRSIDVIQPLQTR